MNINSFIICVLGRNDGNVTAIPQKIFQEIILLITLLRQIFPYATY
jgi:hypothetical protein